MDVSVLLFWLLFVWISIYAVSYGIYLCRHKKIGGSIVVFLLTAASAFLTFWTPIR